MASSEAFLDLLDRHIETQKAQLEAAQQARDNPPPAATLPVLARRRAAAAAAAATVVELPSEVAGSKSLSPLERAIYYEIENRRAKLEARSNEADFWEGYYRDDLARKSFSRLSDEQLDDRIRAARSRFDEQRRTFTLLKQVNNSIQATLSVANTLSNISPPPPSQAKRGETGYAPTRQLLDERDDKALEFLRVFNQLTEVRRERQRVKQEILEARHRTSSLLTDIKALRAESVQRLLQTQNPDSSNGSDASIDNSASLRLQRLKGKLRETRCKKEMVTGVMRGLILESGKDWTRTPDICKLVLSLEDEAEDSEDEYIEEDDEEEGGGDDDEEDDDEDEEQDEEASRE